MESLPVKTILSPKHQGWFGSDYTINLYRGCCHGCIYCDSRSDCYGIKEFETVTTKQNALKILSAELSSKRKAGLILTGSMSDPYNPYEKELEITRQALHLTDRFGFGTVILTKSNLVTRDISLLQSVSKHSPAAVNMTITTADDGLCRKIEPNVCPSSTRFEAIQALSESGITCGVLLMPILPFINDTTENIVEIVSRSAKAGAKWIYAGDCFAVSTRDAQKQYMYEQFDCKFPGIKEQYIKNYKNAYWCVSPNKKLWETFKTECRRHNLLYGMDEIVHAIKTEYKEAQLSLF